MKTPVLLNRTLFCVALISSPLLFQRCSLFEQDIDGELSTTLLVNETTSGTNMSYSEEETIDASSDPDIRDNLDKIKEWTASEILYSIMGFSGTTGTTASGSIGFSRESASSPAVSVSVSGVNLSDVSDNGTKYKLSLTSDQLKTIADILDKDQAIKVYLSGQLSTTPATFNVKIYAKIMVKAGL